MYVDLTISIYVLTFFYRDNLNKFPGMAGVKIAGMSVMPPKTA